MIAQSQELYKLYETITKRLQANSPFTTARTAYDGYERLALIDDINIGLDYIMTNSALFLMANSRTHSLASLHIATRRGRSDYESQLTPERYAKWCSQAFDLTDNAAGLLRSYIEAKTAHGAVLNGRIERALALASEDHVKTSGDAWLADSQSDFVQYTVSKASDGHWQCTCPDGQKGAPKVAGQRTCKHIMAVWMSIKAGIDIRSTDRAYRNGAESALCSQCGQNWRKCICPPSGSAPASVAEQREEARQSLGSALANGGGCAHGKNVHNYGRGLAR